MRYLLSGIAIFFISLTGAKAQDFSNKGKDFWVGYGYHQIMLNGNSQEMVLYFATDQVTNITITIPGSGYTQTLTSGALPQVLTSAPIPKAGAQDARLTAASTVGENKGIHITADKPIVAYAHIYNMSVSGASLLFPTNTLGRDYYSINFTNTSNSPNSNCYFYVVASDTGTTTVEITPSAATIGHAANVPFSITLTQGQVYNVMGTTSGNTGTDLTGSRVRSIPSATGGCKKIGVFSGSGRIGIGCPTNTSNSSDNYMVQAFPQSAWGKRFLTSPTGGNMTRNIFRICVSNPATVVTVNGAPIGVPLTNGFYYQLSQINTPLFIDADNPITVAQYITSQGACGNGNPGDPEMIYLSPVEQNISKVSWNATNNFNINNSYYNVIIPNSGTAISSFRLDGNPVLPSAFTVHPQNTNYSYLTQTVSSGTNHLIQSDSGFNAIAYGFGNAESYGYNAGTNIKDFTQQINTVTQYGIESGTNVCKGSPFRFTVSLPYLPDSLLWNFLGATNAPDPPFQNVTQTNPTPDSIRVIAGRTVYYFSLPNFYTFNNIGIYPIRITAFTPPTAGGCGTTQDIDFDLEVTDPPLVNFTFVTPRCVAETVQFNDSTVSVKPTYLWYWNFDDPASGANNISNIKNPTHLFSGPGTYNVRFSAITTAGCVGDTITKQIIIAPLPSGTITGGITVCLNATAPVITFTGTGGSSPYTFTYNINGGTAQTITTSGNSNIATISAPSSVAGTFTYTLTGVQNTGSSLCNSPGITGQSTTVTIKPLPTGTISGTSTVCQNTAAPNITFTGAGGTSPYTFSYTINGGPVLTVVTTSGNSVTVPAPTGTVGTFIYNLTNVSEGSAEACTNTTTGQSATITISPAPGATISGNANTCVNSTGVVVTFTGSNSTNPYTFTYNINGGVNQTISTAAGNNSVTLPVNTSIAGTFTYNLISVQDGTAQNCIVNTSGQSVSVVVSPLPTAAITGNSTVCVNGTSPSITFTGANGTAPYTFSYTLNGTPQAPLVSTGNSVIISSPTNTAGTFVYALTSVSDASPAVCSQNQTGSVTVVVQDLPTATITGTTAACQNSGPVLITFTGAGGTAPYVFTYNINGGANQTVSTTGTNNSVTVSAPTTAVGTFIYTLTQVQEGGSNACTNSVSSGNTATVTVNPSPSASVTGGINVCLNAPTPNVTFTGGNGTAPYTFTYTINGAPQPVVVSSGNSAVLPVPTNTAGTFVYQLTNIQDASSTTCAQAQNVNTTFIIYPQPVASFTNSTPLCDSLQVAFNSSTSSAGSGTLTSYNWNFNDPASGSANTSSQQNPIHLFSAPGSYTVTLTVTTSNGCVSNSSSNTIIINAKPVAGFIVPEVCLLDAFAQFTDTSSVLAPSSINSWNWNFGDPGSGSANTSTQQNPQHTYTTVGNYTVTQIVTTNNGCKDTIVNNLTISDGNPMASFIETAPGSNCANDSVSIINKSTIVSGNITKLEIYWDNVNAPATFDLDDVPVFNEVYKHKYPDFQSPLTKTFAVKVRAYSGQTCFDDTIRMITVNASPRVQFNPIPNACYVQAPFQITQASEIGGVPGTGIFSGPGVSPSGIFDPAGQPVGIPLTIKYVYTSSAAGCRDSATQNIIILDTAQALFTVSNPVCANNAVTFTDNTVPPASTTIVNTTWNFGDGSPVENYPAGSNITHVYPNPGTYTVTMFATTAEGCRTTNSIRNIVVNPLPRPSFTLDKTDYCLPNAVVQFNSSSSTIADGTQNAFTYAWNFGDPASGNQNTSTAANPTHTFVANGPYAVTLTITSGAGCSKDTTISLTSLHPSPVANYDILKRAFCVGQAANVVDKSTSADGNIVNWSWDFGDNSPIVTGQFPPPHTYNSNGTYNIKLTVTSQFGCVKDTSMPVQVFAYPLVDAGENRFVLENGSVTLQPIVTAVQPQYLWTWNVNTPGGYLNNNMIKNPVSSPLSDVTYTLTVTGAGDCQASDTVFIKLLEAPRIPNTFTPNNDNINDFWVIKYLETYPKAKVRVFTRTGELVFQVVGYNKPWNGTKNGKPLPVDTYYYIIEPENGRAPITGYVSIIK